MFFIFHLTTLCCNRVLNWNFLLPTEYSCASLTLEKPNNDNRRRRRHRDGEAAFQKYSILFERETNNMGEVKSVKVDNWGVFFLQKLQNFFNKTDYCDLTLQFRDNSQLKVHRLVLSACTDYFNVLEQTCEIIDDALIMPAEFQADVVVPIVNFMYTGTLEFELKMYGKLLRTAKEMNMTVLLKLLEAHRRTMENVNRQQRVRVANLEI